MLVCQKKITNKTLVEQVLCLIKQGLLLYLFYFKAGHYSSLGMPGSLNTLFVLFCPALKVQSANKQ